ILNDLILAVLLPEGPPAGASLRADHGFANSTLERLMLQIHNSLTRKKEALRPVDPGHVRMYVCGMTVYDFCHLGHARMLVSFDVVQRWLRASGYRVTYVRNITDIDDKIIRRAVESCKRLSDVTSFFIDAMHADERALGVKPPDHEPR